MSDATFWTLDSLPVGVWVGLVPSGEVAYTNQAFRVIVGMEAVTESRIEDVPVTYHVRDRQGQQYPVDKLPFARAVAELRPVVVDDMVLHRSDGVRVYLRAFALPRLDDSGAATHVVVAFVDITREVRVEAERDLVNTRLELVVNHAPIAIWAADLDGTVTLSEGAGLVALGVQSGQLVGQNLFELYAGHPTIPGFIRRGLTGESFSYTATVGAAVFDTWLIPLRDAAGELNGIAGMSHDVSETRQLQARAIQHDHQASMGMLAASVAHEINNPLTYVLGSVASLEREVAQLDELLATGSREVHDVLARIKAELGPVKDGASRIATITRDLRTFSRPDDERSHAIRIEEVLRSAFQLIGKELEARARLVVALGADVVVRANHTRLLQVFLNLLTNAVQALRDDRDQEITVTTRLDDARVIIEVSDTGPGVPEELRERIFEPFVTTKEVGAGTGLGLFVCRNIIRSLDGTIDVHSRPGGGALFRVSLPVAPEAPAIASEPGPPIRPTAPARILVIDDDPIVLRALAGQFDDPKYTVLAFADSKRAFEVLLVDSFDLIYCDLMMREMTGMALERALRDRGSPNADKLVFMTGGAFTAEAQAFVRANASRVVDKPLDIVAETERRLAGSPQPAA